MRKFILTLVVAVCSLAVSAQKADSLLLSSPLISAQPTFESLADSLIFHAGNYGEVISTAPLSRSFFLPAVFDTYTEPDTTSVFAYDYSGNPDFRWLEDALSVERRQRAYRRNLFVYHPDVVQYNERLLPRAPKKYIAVVNPQDHTIDIKEFDEDIPSAPTLEAPEIKKRHWIKDFRTSLQFSQAYVSPNWYQGGNNALNMLFNVYYNVKLNQAFHPNLLFESTFQYKLGINNAPDDTLREYSINEDVLQINSTFGVKAARRWYYSVTAQFKTQIFESYASNSNTLRSAFLSPGELNAGIGMTYNYNNKKKTFQFDASISPLSYSLRTCTNSKINPADYGISGNGVTEHKFGSSIECKLSWKLAYNITYRSRLYGFTDYDRAYADWENTFLFEINKFLTSQLYVNLRYDTDTPTVADDPDWHKLQVKEIISIGFAYKFSSL